MKEKLPVEQKTNKLDQGNDETILQELIYCYFEGLGYSKGAVLKMDDGKIYKCNTSGNVGQWDAIS